MGHTEGFPKTLLEETGQCVYSTISRGVTWTQIAGLGFGDANGVVAVDSSTIWVVTDFGGIF